MFPLCLKSFGRTESKEDELDDGFLDKTSEVGSKCNLAGGVDTQIPVPWSSTAIPVQSGLINKLLPVSCRLSGFYIVLLSIKDNLCLQRNR